VKALAAEELPFSEHIGEVSKLMNITAKIEKRDLESSGNDSCEVGPAQ
jgi:hypothetical protein